MIDTSTVIVRINENGMNAVIDVDELVRDNNSSVIGFCEDASLRITAVNGSSTVIDASMCRYFYDNGFRINSEPLFGTRLDDSSTVASLPTFRMVQQAGMTVSVPKLFMLSFDSLDVLMPCVIDMVVDARFVKKSVDTVSTHDLRTDGTLIIDTSTVRGGSAGTVTYRLKVRVYVADGYTDMMDFYTRQASMINSNMESFMLLRTNPKLTGNIKICVTEDGRMYLDCFKISKTSVLNQMAYRHKALSSDGDYPKDVHRVFGGLPEGELYGVYDDSYDPHKNYFDLGLQIENIYEYGAEFNDDRLYTENLRILAPLYIGKHLPDYFAVFRTDRLLSDKTLSDTSAFMDLLRDGECVKVFDLRKPTAMGTYLSNYRDMLSECFSGTCGLQFIEQEYDPSDDNYRQGRNTWRGIVVGKGIMSKMTETTYFATKTLNSSCPQENYDLFLLNGYSRNGLLYPNILNLEFYFNDPDKDDFTINNYYGLYLTENAFVDFSQVLMEVDSQNPVMTYYDGSGDRVELADTSVSVIQNSSFSDRVFFASTVNDAVAVRTLTDVNNFVRSNVCNHPYVNMVDIEGNAFTIDSADKSFMTMRLTRAITEGEHFRFIATGADGRVSVLEMIASSDRRLLDCDHMVNPWISTNIPCYGIPSESDDIRTDFYRLSFYAYDDGDGAATLSVQLDRIAYCISRFDSFIKVGSVSGDTISFLSTCRNTLFQHVMVDDDGNDYIHYYNDMESATCVDFSEMTDLYANGDLALSMYGMETMGARRGVIVGFMNSDTYDGRCLYEIYEDIDERISRTDTPLVSTMNGYYPLVRNRYDRFGVTFGDTARSSTRKRTGDETFVMYSIYDVTCSMVVTPYEIANRNINICSPMACSVSLMGIQSIKDIDMYIGHSVDERRESCAQASFARNERVRTDGSDVRIRPFEAYRIVSGSISGIPVSSNTIFMVMDDGILSSNDNGGMRVTAISGGMIRFSSATVIELANQALLDTYDYTSHHPLLREKNCYVTPGNIGWSKLSIPFVPLVNCQWKSNGCYLDNNSILDVSTLAGTYSPEGNFVENTYNPAGDLAGQYIVRRLDSMAGIDGDGYHTLREMIMDNGYKGVIKKFLAAGERIDSAVATYNPYVQSLSFIYYGLKFTYSLANTQYRNEIKLNEYDNYEVFVMNDYGGGTFNEMFIDIDDEIILIVNHIYGINGRHNDPRVKTFNIHGNIVNAPYTWSEAPYSYVLSNTAFLSQNTFLQKEGDDICDKSHARYFIQMDLPVYAGGFSADEEPVFMALSMGDNYRSLTDYDVAGPEFALTFINPASPSGAYEYSNVPDYIRNTYMTVSSYGSVADKAQDYRTRYPFMVNYCDEGVPSALTYSEKIDAFRESFTDGDLTIHIISDKAGESRTIEVNDDYRPINLTVDEPVRVKFNQGLFDPAFVDIVEFCQDDGISSQIDMDTLYANTHVSAVSRIPSYYYNKILEMNYVCHYNYFHVDGRSIISTCWDSDIYRLYYNDSQFKTVKGYSLGITDKMFFGSAGLVLTGGSVTLGEWGYGPENYSTLGFQTASLNTQAMKYIYIHLNLTKTFYNYIANETSFAANWNCTGDFLNIKTYINNYIDNVLIGLFDMNQFTVYIYRKRQNHAVSDYFVKSLPADLPDYTQVTNVGVNKQEINNEVVVTLDIPYESGYVYYTQIKLNKN